MPPLSHSNPAHFDYQLTSKLIAKIRNIRRFSNVDKLATFAGVAHVKFSFLGKGKERSSGQNNRQLHGPFYFLAVTMVFVPKVYWY